MEDLVFNDAVFGSGNGPFLPVVFCLDVSGSMTGRIQELQNGLRQFIEDVKNDEVAKRTAQGAVITFGTSVDVIQKFAPVTDWQIPILKAEGSTDLIGAVKTALQMLEDKKQNYKKEGCTYYQPWLVILSDGGQYPENPSGLDNIASEVSNLARNNKLVPFSIGVGNEVFWDDMKKFSKDQNMALELKNTHSFREFFLFFSASASETVRSTVSEGHQIDIEAMKRAFNVKS